ncbi:MAG: hydratase, partial [Evtepia sp.]
MITLHSGGVSWQKGAPVPAPVVSPAGREKTMAYQIFRRHSIREEAGQLHLKFDSLISHDITYVGIIQTAKASGLTEFPVP